MRTPEQRTSRPVTGAKRCGVVAAIATVTLLGNLRLQASEVGNAPAPRAPRVGALVSPAIEPGASHFTGSDAGGSGVEPTRVPRNGVDKDTQLVPAIYAWDKDVRFVYYRHMSKWM